MMISELFGLAREKVTKIVTKLGPKELITPDYKPFFKQVLWPCRSVTTHMDVPSIQHNMTKQIRNEVTNVLVAIHYIPHDLRVRA